MATVLERELGRAKKLKALSLNSFKENYTKVFSSIEPKYLPLTILKIAELKASTPPDIEAEIATLKAKLAQLTQQNQPETMQPFITVNMSNDSATNTKPVNSRQKGSKKRK
jgi:hypothetical protein